MDNKQRIIVVLLVLAILFSAVSILISMEVFFNDSVAQASPQVGGGSSQVALTVEGSTAQVGGAG